jgi:uncharacterized membrane protein YbhN (UPF0104 family)
MDVEQIGRKTVAFFFLTSLANVSILIVFASLYAVGVLGRDPRPAVTYLFGGLALGSVVGVLALPAIVRRLGTESSSSGTPGRVASALALVRRSVLEGVPDAELLLRRRSPGVLLGSFGTTVFDLAVMAGAFRATGVSPPIGVLTLGYLIGMLGGNVPVPGGIGGVDAGLIGTFTLFHEPLGATTVAVLTYHAIALWVPAVLGSVAFVRLRATLQREERPAMVCAPLAETIEGVSLTAAVAEPG